MAVTEARATHVKMCWVTAPGRVVHARGDRKRNKQSKSMQYKGESKHTVLLETKLNIVVTKNNTGYMKTHCNQKDATTKTTHTCKNCIPLSRWH